MNPACAKDLTTIIELLKLVMTSPSISIGGRLYGSRVFCDAWMKLLSETGIVLLDGPRVSSPAILDYFAVSEVSLRYLWVIYMK